MKIDYPKLRNDSRKDKKSSKEKFKKFRKAFAAWRESDIDTFDDKSSDQEVEKLWLVAKEKEINEVSPLMNYKIFMMNYMKNH